MSDPLKDALRKRRENNPNPIKPIPIAMNYLISKFVAPMLRSWKTTLAGVGLVATGVGMLTHSGIAIADGDTNVEAVMSGWGNIVAGIGLILGRDANVSSRDSGV